MKIRISTGELRGRFITIPDEHNDFRPTKDMVRQAVLNSLGTRVRGSNCADVCAGSGAFGIELLSRGAVKVDFVESDIALVRCLHEHIRRFELETRTEVRNTTARIFSGNCAKKYDIIIFDPPYSDVGLAELIVPLCNIIEDDGILVYEKQSVRNSVFNPPEGFVADCRTYGKTEIVYLTKAGT